MCVELGASGCQTHNLFSSLPSAGTGVVSNTTLYNPDWFTLYWELILLPLVIPGFGDSEVVT